MKLTYWYSGNLHDSNCYSIRARTKREAVAMREEQNKAHKMVRYGKVRKVVVEYKDAFDLLSRCLDEGGIHGDNVWPEDYESEDQESDECVSCDGFGHFRKDGTSTVDRRERKCLECSGTGRPTIRPANVRSKFRRASEKA